MAFLVAAAASTLGAYTQGMAQSQAAEYNAKIAQQNAEIARQQGAAAAEAQGRDAQRKIGAMVAAYGASGVQGDTGSPMDVLADSVRNAALDKLNIQYNYALKALGYSNQATLASAQADNYKTSAVVNAIAAGAKSAGQAIPMFGGGGEVTDGGYSQGTGSAYGGSRKGL